VTRRLAPLLAALALGGCRAEPARPPDVVLVLIDTLRADHVGAYGYARPITPSLDALCAQATLFENAIAQAPHTIPSMLQLMTSRYAQGLEIPAADRTLAEALQAQGYDTLAVVENPNFEQHPTAHGLKRGFRRFYRNGVIDRVSLAQQLYRTNTPADAVTAQTARALRTRDRAKPLFLWVHYFDPHDPYLPPFADDLEALSQDSPSPYTGDVRATDVYLKDPPPRLSPADRGHIVALYDAEVRYADQAVGELFALLRAEGLYENALIVVASDHGESLGEHGVWTHGRSAWDAEIRVPLIVRRPGQARPERVRDAVELLDVFPTVLDLAGLPADGLRLDGESLFRHGGRPAFLFWKQWQVVRTAEWKLVQAGDGLLLYRIDQDPGEERDLFAARGDVARSLLAARDARLRAAGASAQELDERSRAAWERLRALGYLDH
jgi:arylsulfatase